MDQLTMHDARTQKKQKGTFSNAQFEDLLILFSLQWLLANGAVHSLNALHKHTAFWIGLLFPLAHFKLFAWHRRWFCTFSGSCTFERFLFIFITFYNCWDLHLIQLAKNVVSVCSYAPKHHIKFLVCEKPDSDSEHFTKSSFYSSC